MDPSVDRDLSRGMHVFRFWERQGDSKSPATLCCKRHKGNWGSCEEARLGVYVAQKVVREFQQDGSSKILDKSRLGIITQQPVSKKAGSGSGVVTAGLRHKNKLTNPSRLRNYVIRWSCVGYQVGSLKPREARRRKWFVNHIWKHATPAVKEEPRAIQRFFGLVSRYGFSKAWGVVREKGREKVRQLVVEGSSTWETVRTLKLTDVQRRARSHQFRLMARRPKANHLKYLENGIAGAFGEDLAVLCKEEYEMLGDEGLR